jgi:hypothetical protein
VLFVLLGDSAVVLVHTHAYSLHVNFMGCVVVVRREPVRWHSQQRDLGHVGLLFCWPFSRCFATCQHVVLALTIVVFWVLSTCAHMQCAVSQVFGTSVQRARERRSAWGAVG